MATEQRWAMRKRRDSIAFAASASGPDGFGDFRVEIRPGQVVAGLAYEEWRSVPEGVVVVESEAGRWTRLVSPHRVLKRAEP